MDAASASTVAGDPSPAEEQSKKDSQFAAEQMEQFRKVDLRAANSTSQLSFQELKDRISKAKAEAEAKGKGKGTKDATAKAAAVNKDKALNELILQREPFELSKTLGKVAMPGAITLAPEKRDDRTIKRFRNLSKAKTFDTSFVISETLKKEIYRTPINDGSGHRIFNLGRDLVKGKPWYC